MNIAIDYDNTYTAAPALWTGFINGALYGGHDIAFVTVCPRRGDISEAAVRHGISVFFTEGEQKQSFCERIGWVPDIWIDDDPVSIPTVDMLEKQAAGCRKWGEQ